FGQKFHNPSRCARRAFAAHAVPLALIDWPGTAIAVVEAHLPGRQIDVEDVLIADRLRILGPAPTDAEIGPDNAQHLAQVRHRPLFAVIGHVLVLALAANAAA